MDWGNEEDDLGTVIGSASETACDNYQSGQLAEKGTWKLTNRPTDAQA